MVNVKVIVLMLLVLPAILAGKSTSCNVAVTQTLSDSGRYNTYSATATNNGNSAASNVLLTPSVTLKSLDGLDKTDTAYSISSLAAGASTTFTYKVKSGSNVRWTATCSGSSSAPSTSAPSTNAPSTKPATNAPSQGSTTKAPTTKPSTKPASTTKAPTTKAPSTSAPSSGTTAKAPTTKPSTGGGRLCPTGSWWAPAPLTTWQWQLTGTIDTTKNVQMYDIDLFDATTTLINTLHSQGKAVICYFSTQYENWRPDASSFTSAVKGNGLDGWEGENYVDIRSTVVRNIMTSRLDLAVSKGCDGVEPDNVDGYQASTGFPLTAADQIDFNTFIANQAHSRSLSVGLKNDIDQAKTLQTAFDWALNEQCYEYSECSSLNVFVSAGKAVFNCEYSGSGSTVCPYMNNLKFSSLIKSLDLDASIKSQCCTYQSPSCAPAAFTCKSGSSKRRRSVESVTETQQETVAADNDIATQELTASASTTCASVFAVALVVLAALNF